jgi:hypothetical protein
MLFDLMCAGARSFSSAHEERAIQIRCVDRIRISLAARVGYDDRDCELSEVLPGDPRLMRLPVCILLCSAIAVFAQRGPGSGRGGGEEGGGRGISNAIGADGNARSLGCFYPVQRPPSPDVARREETNMGSRGSFVTAID